MSQRTVEVVIGKLLTDEELRRRFMQKPLDTLIALREQGYELSNGGVEALLETDTAVWSWCAGRISACLQRCSLRDAH